LIKTINLDRYNLIDTKATSSKGNQQKWLVDDLWYKADHMGYEALCEVIISKLLTKSNVDNFVIYHPTKIEFDNKIFNGCYSKNFKGKNESIVTLEHMAKNWLANSMAKELLNYDTPEDKIKHTVEFIERVTNLENVGAYITMMLELDAFFLNEDRHTNNIAFILNDETGEYKFCPYFDFGLSLLADTTEDYPIGIDIYKGIDKIQAKPFSSDFDMQLEAATKLYGDQLKLSFTNTDIENAFEAIENYYPAEIIARAKNLLYNQKHKYGYLLK
jgi:tRNA A-37 threonylcarbamoyl transferase component Bud32